MPHDDFAAIPYEILMPIGRRARDNRRYSQWRFCPCSAPTLREPCSSAPASRHALGDLPELALGLTTPIAEQEPRRMSLYDRIMGEHLATRDEHSQKVGPLAGIPMLGLDALSSAAYGPEAALTILLGIGTLGTAYILPITGLIILLLAIVYVSYRQTMFAYPQGGGSYTVAKENLGTRMGLLAAASLLIDYTLNVAVGIAAGVGALISIAPALHPYILPLCLFILVLITLVNLHGIRESGMAFVIPTYLFVGTLGLIIAVGVAKTVLGGGHPLPVEVPPEVPLSSAGAGFWLLLRAFANGCTAMTGVEAISNGIPAFREPGVRNAQRTLTAVIVILALLLGGIALLCRSYGIAATDPDGASYQSILSQLTAAVTGRGPFYYVTMGSVVAVVCLSANTSFADFPRLCRLLALDNYLPFSFAGRNRRLVNAGGILALAVMACILLVAFGGVTDRLIPLFALGAFSAFTLSQAGMVVHWMRLTRQDGADGIKRPWASMIINAVGAVSTGLVLVVVLVTKFLDGAWIVLLLMPLLCWLFASVQRHYAEVWRQTRCEQPLDVSDLRPPVVVIVMRQWSSITRNAILFGMATSPDVVLVHIRSDEEAGEHLARKFSLYVQQPLEAVGRPCPRLVFVESPYRRFFGPLFETLNALCLEHPGRTVAVVVSELVGGRWYDYFLHNQRSTALKAALLLRGDRRLVVVNVPWRLARAERSNFAEQLHHT